MDAMGALGMGIFGIFYFLFMIAYLGISIYVIVLFIKLAKRGIQALDIYLSKNSLTKPSVEGEYHG